MKMVADSEIASAYLDGKTMREVGNTFGLTSSAIFSRLKKMGVKTRKPGRKIKRTFTREQIRTIHNRYHNGHTLQSISNEMGIPHHALISQIRKSKFNFIFKNRSDARVDAVHLYARKKRGLHPYIGRRRQLRKCNAGVAL